MRWWEREEAVTKQECSRWPCSSRSSGVALGGRLPPVPLFYIQPPSGPRACLSSSVVSSRNEAKRGSGLLAGCFCPLLCVLSQSIADVLIVCNCALRLCGLALDHHPLIARLHSRRVLTTFQLLNLLSVQPPVDV